MTECEACLWKRNDEAVLARQLQCLPLVFQGRAALKTAKVGHDWHIVMFDTHVSWCRIQIGSHRRGTLMWDQLDKQRDLCAGCRIAVRRAAQDAVAEAEQRATA